MKNLLMMLLCLVSACVFAASEYTLYRSGIDVASRTQDDSLRIHIGTFDATLFKDAIDNEKYNRANCDYAQEFFNVSQPHFRGSNLSDIKARYWCEEGRYRK